MRNSRIRNIGINPPSILYQTPNNLPLLISTRNPPKKPPPLPSITRVVHVVSHKFPSGELDARRAAGVCGFRG